ncbi:type II secretion system protein [Candidatus Kaiserbacteria bacterium]|nr:type II secretion system protein [Candidatus Kaiserbacteria bacterium]
MYKHRSQGFTLIELLVVIAIIGVLSAVVLTSLNSARSKGNDAAIQSDLATIRTQSEIYYGGTGVNTYGTAVTSCTTGMFIADTTIQNSIKAADSANGAGVMVCNASATAYAVSSPLLTTAGTFWCVDSTGFAGSKGTPLGTNTICPAT